MLHRGDETQQRRNSCPRLQFLAFSLNSIMSLPRYALYVVSALHHCLLVFLFLADQIFYRLYVNRQYFRLWSFASLCLRWPNPVKCNACAVARKIKTDCFSRNVPFSSDPVVRLFSLFAHYELTLNPFRQHCSNKILT